jgi:hypothetical protein
MADQSDKISKLKELIYQSRIFNGKGKTALIGQIPDLSDQQTEKAVQIFEKEKKGWESIVEKSNKNLALIKQFAVKSKNEIRSLAKRLVLKNEKKESEKEKGEAENLINQI